MNRDLLERAINKEDAALTEIYTEYYGMLRNSILYLLKNEADTEDVLQDTFIKIFSSLSDLKTPEAFPGWAKQIAVNKAKDRLKKNTPLLFSDVYYPDGEDDGTIPEIRDEKEENIPEIAIDKQETERLINEILFSLPIEQRVAVSLYYYEGYTVSEIAKQLSVTDSAVKSRLSYARKKIEEKVLDLEKKGTKLYGLLPVPFLIALLKKNNTYAAENASTVAVSLLKEKAIEEAARAAAESAAKTVVKQTLAKNILMFLIPIIGVSTILGVINVNNRKAEPAEVVEEYQTEHEASEEGNLERNPAPESIMSGALSSAKDEKHSSLVINRDPKDLPKKISRYNIYNSKNWPEYAEYYEYEYDENGRKLSETRYAVYGEKGPKSYGVEDLDRLADNVPEEEKVVYTYVYDENGMLSTLKRSNNIDLEYEINEIYEEPYVINEEELDDLYYKVVNKYIEDYITELTGVVPTYNLTIDDLVEPHGTLLKRVEHVGGNSYNFYYDSDTGKLIVAGGAYYKYDDKGRVIRITSVGKNGNIGMITRYVYDENGLKYCFDEYSPGRHTAGPVYITYPDIFFPDCFEGHLVEYQSRNGRVERAEVYDLKQYNYDIRKMLKEDVIYIIEYDD